MRRVALFALITGMLLLVWFATRQSSRHKSPMTNAPAVSAENAEESGVLEQTAAGDARTEVAAPAIDEHDATAGAVQPTTSVTLHGTVVVVDDGGVEYPRESGTLGVVLWKGGTTRPVLLAVVNGQWEYPIGDFTKIQPARSVLGGKAAFPEVSDEGMPISREGPCVIRLRWSPPLVLHACDAHTGQDVANLEVRLDEVYAYRDRALVPNPVTKAAAQPVHGSSPLVIIADQLVHVRQSGVLSVRAPGYAWNHAAFDLREGGDVFVDLRPACGIDVELAGAKPPRRALLRVRDSRTEATVLTSLIDGRDRIAIEDIPEGTYKVTAQLGIGDSNEVVLADALVSVATDSRAQVRLRLAPAPAVERASMYGVLVVPHEWNVSKVRMHAAFLDRAPDAQPTLNHVTDGGTVSTNDESDTYSWKLEDVHIGRYLFWCREPPFSQVLELPRGGASGARLDIGPAAFVEVRVLDKHTKEPTALGHVVWMSKDARDSDLARNTVNLDTPSCTCSFRAPLGDICVSSPPDSLAYEVSRSDCALKPGVNVVTLLVERATGLRVSVFDGARCIPADTVPDIKVDAHGTDGRISWSSFRGPIYVARLSQAGSYRISLSEPFSGYLMPAEQIVDLEPHTTTDVVIRLTRKP